MFEVYSLVLFAHVVAAVVLVGHSLGSPLVRAALREAGSADELRRIVALERRGARWHPIVAIVLLLSGVYLGRVGWWTQGWFHASIGAWTVNALLAGLVVQPTMVALSSSAVGEGRIPPDVDRLRRSRKLAAGAQIMLANDLALLFLMFNKPSLIESLAVCALTNVVCVALALAPRRTAVATLSEAGS